MTPLSMRLALLIGLTLTVGTTLVSPVEAQDRNRGLPRYKIDPYTKNDPEIMEHLGYVSYGPFEFGQRGRDPLTTDVLDEQYPDEELLWVETEHYRIGLGLETDAVPQNPERKALIRAELERLKERGLPRVNPKARRLDRWLRLHLYAQRIEDHYAEMERLYGVTDETFPQDAEQRMSWPGDYAGEGPFLGQKNKFLILLFEHQGPFEGFMRDFLGRRSKLGQHWNFIEVDSLIYTYCAESVEDDGRLKKDEPMHAHVIHSITHQLVDGYMHYSYDLPVWIRSGLAHYFERQVTPKFNSFLRGEGSTPFGRVDWKFEKVARKLIVKDEVTPFSALNRKREYAELTFEDHVLAWSRMQYLLTLGDEKFATFMRLSKTQVDKQGQVSDNIVEGVRDALKEAYGMSPLTLDERWKAWALETYPAK